MAQTRSFAREPRPVEETIQFTPAPLPWETFRPLPAPTGPAPYRVRLADLGVPDPPDSLLLHATGDVGGIIDPHPQQQVAALMAAAPSPSLLYIVGDVVYFNGRDSEYFAQFYEPYEELGWPIVAVPGNHDGDDSDDPSVPSLTGFVRNFCQPSPAPTPDAHDVPRDAMTLPNAYWTLEANTVTIVGLYSNVPSGGVIKADQADWLAGELAAAPTDRPLIVALHHPPYSADTSHGGSKPMGAVLDAAFATARRYPNMVLSGHVHCYQRFTRAGSGPRPPITYVVCGAGGYHNLYSIARGIKHLPYTIPGSDVTLEAYERTYGFLELTATRQGLSAAFVGVSGPGDKFTC